jgi:hypothetical protein
VVPFRVRIRYPVHALTGYYALRANCYTLSGVFRCLKCITKHLRVMEEAGLVRSTRRGRESVWQLDRRRLAVARRYLGVI